MSETTSTAMEPKIVHLQWTRGDTRKMILTLTDEETGAALNISGYTFSLAVDELEEPTTPSTTNKFTLTGTIVDAGAGKVSFQMSAGEADQTPNEYYFDAQFVNGTEKFTFMKGKWTVVQDRDKT